MQYSQLIDLTLARALRLGLRNKDTGLVDSADVEVALYEALLDLTGHYDLDGFIVMNETLFVTTEGVDTYALPDDFARFVTPRDKDRYGVGVYDGGSLSFLDYQRPDEMVRLRQTTNNRPRWYTITAYGKLALSPTPDANGTANYIGRGVYVRDILPDELEHGTVPLGYPLVLEKLALAQLCTDLGHPQAQAMQGESLRAITALVNGQERQRMTFKNRGTEVGRTGRTGGVW